MDLIEIANYIDGELVPPSGGEYLDNYNPSIGEVYSQIPRSNSNDVDNAYSAANGAFKEWSEMPKEKRSKLLLRLADLIDENHEKLYKAESLDNGKPHKLAAHVDVPRASANIRFSQLQFYIFRPNLMIWMVLI